MIITDDKKKQWCVNPRKIDMAGIGNRQKPGGEQLIGFCLTLVIGQMQITTGVFETIETAQLALDAVLAEMEKETPEDRAHRTAAALDHARMEQIREDDNWEDVVTNLRKSHDVEITQLKDIHYANIKEMNKVHHAESKELEEEIGIYSRRISYILVHPWKNLFNLKEKI